MLMYQMSVSAPVAQYAAQTDEQTLISIENKHSRQTAVISGCIT